MPGTQSFSLSSHVAWQQSRVIIGHGHRKRGFAWTALKLYRVLFICSLPCTLQHQRCVCQPWSSVLSLYHIHAPSSVLLNHSLHSPTFVSSISSFHLCLSYLSTSHWNDWLPPHIARKLDNADWSSGCKPQQLQKRGLEACLGVEKEGKVVTDFFLPLSRQESVLSSKRWTGNCTKLLSLLWHCFFFSFFVVFNMVNYNYVSLSVYV